MDGCVFYRYIIPVMATETGREMAWQTTKELLDCRRALLARRYRVDEVRGATKWNSNTSKSGQERKQQEEKGSPSSETGFFPYFN